MDFSCFFFIFFYFLLSKLTLIPIDSKAIAAPSQSLTSHIPGYTPSELENCLVACVRISLVSLQNGHGRGTK